MGYPAGRAHDEMRNTVELVLLLVVPHAPDQQGLPQVQTLPEYFELFVNLDGELPARSDYYTEDAVRVFGEFLKKGECKGRGFPASRLGVR